MKNSYYVYNNEALSCCVVLEILKIVRSMDFDRLCLVLPFLLDNNTIKVLGSKSIEDKNFLIEASNIYCNFNKRYITLLPVMINSIVILEKLKKVNLSEKNISYIESKFSNDFLGKRLENIKNVLPLFVKEFNRYTTSELYESLGIEL